MVRHAEKTSRERKLAELKRLITSRRYDSLEKLEEAVDALLWGEEETHEKQVRELSELSSPGRSPAVNRPR